MRGRGQSEEKEDLIPILLRLRPDLLGRIDEEWHRRGLMTRTDTIRALLEEALKP